MNQKGNSLFMGRSLYNRAPLSLTAENHMLTIGGSRGGKGATVSIPNLLLWRHSAVVIDIKRTHAAVTARYRSEGLGQKVHFIEPFAANGETARFDPLWRIKSNPEALDIREQIGALADALVVKDKNVKEPHWDEGAKTVIAGLIAHLVTSPDYNNVSLPMIRNLLTMNPDQQADLWAAMSYNEAADGLAKDAAARVTRGIETSEILGILSNADKHTEHLSSRAIKKVLSEIPTFSLEEIRKEPTTIYAILPPHYLEEHKRFLRLFINSVTNEMSVGGRSPTSVLLLMDEFLSYDYMREIVKAFNLLAGLNLTCWPIIQGLGPLKDLYKDSADAFITNSRAVQVFAVDDETTTRYVSEKIGERSMQYVRGINDSLRTPPLRTPSEVAREISADSDCQYILRGGKVPHYLQKVRYYEDRIHWKSNVNIPAWLMRRRYPFFGKYDNDPDFS